MNNNTQFYTLQILENEWDHDSDGYPISQTRFFLGTGETYQEPLTLSGFFEALFSERPKIEMKRHVWVYAYNDNGCIREVLTNKPVKLWREETGVCDLSRYVYCYQYYNQTMTDQVMDDIKFLTSNEKAAAEYRRLLMEKQRQYLGEIGRNNQTANDVKDMIKNYHDKHPKY